VPLGRHGEVGAALSPVAGAVYSSRMKIIRLKRGYRISLSDGEFDALSQGGAALPPHADHRRALPGCGLSG
jgi:hypothetical protein